MVGKRNLQTDSTMKMMKILMTCVMALILLLVACGGTASTNPPIPTSTSTVAPTDEPTRAASISTPTSPASSTTGQATLEIRVTDAPPEGVSKIEITVGSVEVNRSEGPSPVGWETVISQPQTFDLVQLTGVEGILGSSLLEPGRYNQVRMVI